MKGLQTFALVFSTRFCFKGKLFISEAKGLPEIGCSSALPKVYARFQLSNAATPIPKSRRKLDARVFLQNIKILRQYRVYT